MSMMRFRWMILPVTLCLVTGLFASSVEAANGVSAKIPFDPNPTHWFNRTEKSDKEIKAEAAAKKAAREKTRADKAHAKAESLRKKEAAGRKKEWAKHPDENALSRPAPDPLTGAAPAISPPPDKDYLLNHCESIRNKVVTINKRPFFVRPFLETQKSFLIHQHAACVKEFTQQEVRFIRDFDFANKQSPAINPQVLPEGAELRITPPAAK